MGSAFTGFSLSSLEYTQQYAETDVYPRMELNVVKEDYEPYATGLFSSEFFEEEWEAVLEYSAILDLYRFSSCWMNGYDVTFSWDGGDNIVVNGGESLPTGFMDSGYGMVNVTPVNAAYNASAKTLMFAYEWTVSGGSFGVYVASFSEILSKSLILHEPFLHSNMKKQDGASS